MRFELHISQLAIGFYLCWSVLAKMNTTLYKRQMMKTYLPWDPIAHRGGPCIGEILCFDEKQSRIFKS